MNYVRFKLLYFNSPQLSFSPAAHYNTRCWPQAENSTQPILAFPVPDIKRFYVAEPVIHP